MSGSSGSEEGGRKNAGEGTKTETEEKKPEAAAKNVKGEEGEGQKGGEGASAPEASVFDKKGSVNRFVDGKWVPRVVKEDDKDEGDKKDKEDKGDSGDKEDKEKK